MRVTVHPWESGFRHMAEHLRAMMHAVDEPRDLGSRVPISWTPRLNLYETADRYVVCAELAGMPRSEITVWTADFVLHISGNRKKPVPPDNPQEVGVHLMEIDSGRFHRQIPLAEDAALDGITAIYRQGYLWVVVPRQGESGSTAP